MIKFYLTLLLLMFAVTSSANAGFILKAVEDAMREMQEIQIRQLEKIHHVVAPIRVQGPIITEEIKGEKWREGGVPNEIRAAAMEFEPNKKEKPTRGLPGAFNGKVIYPVLCRIEGEQEASQVISLLKDLKQETFDKNNPRAAIDYFKVSLRTYNPAFSEQFSPKADRKAHELFAYASSELRRQKRMARQNQVEQNNLRYPLVRLNTYYGHFLNAFSSPKAGADYFETARNYFDKFIENTQKEPLLKKAYYFAWKHNFAADEEARKEWLVKGASLGDEKATQTLDVLYDMPLVRTTQLQVHTPEENIRHDATIKTGKEEETEGVASTLTTLDLDTSTLSSLGMEHIIKLVRNGVSVRKISLNNYDIDLYELKSLAASLKENVSLQSLNLAGTRMYKEGAVAIAASLKGNTSLRYLNLANSAMESGGAVALAAILRENTSLQYLNLVNNNIEKEGAAALAASLKGNASLRYLNLADNNIRNKGAVTLAESLKGNTSLHYLNLAGNRISKEGAVALAESLKGNTSLQYLNLAGNRIPKKGAVALAESLRGNTSLQCLNLADNNIREEEAATLAAVFKGNTSIHYLNLANSEIRKKEERLLQYEEKGYQYRGKVVKTWQEIESMLEQSFEKAIEESLYTAGNYNALDKHSAPEVPANPEETTAYKSFIKQMKTLLRSGEQIENQEAYEEGFAQAEMEKLEIVSRYGASFAKVKAYYDLGKLYYFYASAHPNGAYKNAYFEKAETEFKRIVDKYQRRDPYGRDEEESHKIEALATKANGYLRGINPIRNLSLEQKLLEQQGED